jgi:hypothetical protein
MPPDCTTKGGKYYFTTSIPYYVSNDKARFKHEKGYRHFLIPDSHHNY